MAYVRKNFGEVSCCGFFEVYENGHNQIHCILLFEKVFKVFRDLKEILKFLKKHHFKRMA
jgi:hypothetical protein